MSFLSDHWDVLLAGSVVTLLCMTGVGAGIALVGTQSTLSFLGLSVSTKVAGAALVTLSGVGGVASNVTCVSIVSNRERARIEIDIANARGEADTARAAADRAEETNRRNEEAARVFREQQQRNEAEVKRMAEELKRLEEELAKQTHKAAEHASTDAEQDQDAAEKAVPSRSSRPKW